MSVGLFVFNFLDSGIFTFLAFLSSHFKFVVLLNRQNVFVFGCGLLLVSQIFSPFLLSLSMWIMVYAALVRTNSRGQLRLNLGESFQNFYKNPTFWPFSVLFAVTLISGLWSTDLKYWLERTQVRLPFFILPLAFANRPHISERQFLGLCSVFLVVIFGVGAGVLTNYLLHFDQIMTQISAGGAIPAPRNHIRFSLLVVLGAAVGWQLFERRFYWKWAAERWVWLIMTAFLVVLVHILAVRSGLAALYAVLIWVIFQLIYREKKYKFGIVLTILILLAPMFAAKYSPSLRAKITYMIWDIRHGAEYSAVSASDTDRIISLRAGWQLFLDNPILGVGSGDLPTEVQREALKQNPALNKDIKLPHNQIIYILSATGIFGILCSFFAFFWPIYKQKQPKEPLFSIVVLMLMVSFLVEYPIEGTYGAVFAAFFMQFFGMKNLETEQEIV